MVTSIKKSLFIILTFAQFLICAKSQIPTEIVKPKVVSGPMEVCGYGNFRNRTFDQRVNANGKIELNEVTLKKSLSVNGSASIKKSTFLETVDSNGLMEAHDSKFENTVTFEGKLFLNNSELKDIIIANHFKKNPSKLILKGETVVNGDITFEGEPGTIELHKKARINGAVKNGKVINKK